MKTEYKLQNGNVIKCEYSNGNLRIDEEIAFRTVANENGEKERVIAIDLNTGLTTNKYINENSKVKPSLEMEHCMPMVDMREKMVSGMHIMNKRIDLNQFKNKKLWKN